MRWEAWTVIADAEQLNGGWHGKRDRQYLRGRILR
jgi:hypothetical protein